MLTAMWTTKVPIDYIGVAIAKSTNGGKNWKRIYFVNVPPEVGGHLTYSLNAISCVSNRICFVAGNKSSNDFLLKTDDGGATWSTSSTDDHIFSDLDCPTASICYGVTGVPNAPIYRSANGGITWSSVPIPTNFIHDPNYEAVASYRLYTVTCNTLTWCAAGGESMTSDTKASYPIVWMTPNGSSWLYHSPIETSPDPSHYKSSVLAGAISCPRVHYCLVATS
jgi:photosystem II stability/assembly factor-like uncharacterized protein